MDSRKRERLIELGAQISDLRVKIATFQSRLAETEAELDALFADITPTSSSSDSTAPVPSVDGSERIPSEFTSNNGLRERHAKTGLVIPPVIGSLSDQALAVLNANPDRTFSGDVLTECLNKMAGRVALANVDSVNAALSRLTTDDMIQRIERGVYKAKPAINTSYS